MGSERHTLESDLRSQLHERFECGVDEALRLYDAVATEKARADKAEADLAQERKRHEGTLNLLMAKAVELAALRQRVGELEGRIALAKDRANLAVAGEGRWQTRVEWMLKALK